MILPIKLNSTVHATIHQISATGQLTVRRKLDGSPYVHIIGCYASSGFNDVFLEGDGLFEDIFNAYFRRNAAAQMRKQLPIRVCKMMQSIVEKRINAPLRGMSKVIPLNKLSNFAKRAINSIKLADLPKHCRTTLCKRKIEHRQTISHLSASTGNFNTVPIDSQPVFTENDNTDVQEINDKPSMHRFSLAHAEALQRVTSSPTSPTSANNGHRMDASASLDPCADCYSSNNISQYENDNKTKILSNTVLNMKLIKISATPDYFQLGLRAAFGSQEMSETPFHPFPMHFPRFLNGNSKRMLDVLISDYTINSLLYHMHKNDAIMFRVGPETPKLSGLLKTTCSDEDYDDFEDFVNFE
uniref:BPI2 domain-containing protein n=1 Tax=Elaeophora elaphi TaxID=1147741 RepID=A0A0R3RM52_9BILA